MLSTFSISKYWTSNHFILSMHLVRKVCHGKIMLKNGKIFLSQDHSCKDKILCDIAIIDATERMADQVKTAPAEPPLSANKIALKIMVATQQELGKGL
jgi:hypothetical protein